MVVMNLRLINLRTNENNFNGYQNYDTIYALPLYNNIDNNWRL